MAGGKDSVLDKAESAARRILERLGSKVDSNLARAEQTVSSRIIADLSARIEQTIESNLREDEGGVRRVSPNRFKVLFTYEETSPLSAQYIEAVGRELTANVFEYINNRRYATLGSVKVEASRDLFAKETLVKASFGGDVAEALPSDAGSRENESKRLHFSTVNGQSYCVELKAEGAPAYAGRAAGNAIRIDDPSVSRLHCSLSLRRSGEVVIADLGSANGTYVNEQLLGPAEARHVKQGDVLGIGDFKLTVSEIC